MRGLGASAPPVNSATFHSPQPTVRCCRYNAAQAVYPHMKAAGRGKIVLISSIAGSRSACHLGLPWVIGCFDDGMRGAGQT